MTHITTISGSLDECSRQREVLEAVGFRMFHQPFTFGESILQTFTAPEVLSTSPNGTCIVVAPITNGT